MSLNGGLLQIAKGGDLTVDTPDFQSVPIKTGGYGIIGERERTTHHPHDTSFVPGCTSLTRHHRRLADLGWKGSDEIWAVGGGGTMYASKDGGKSFKFDNSADDIPGNLYQVKFANNNGFVLGSDGVLLRYSGQV